ncbi:MAG: type IVB secretion system protein IcmH/DotU, partial [Acidobacteriota bacterium]
MQTTIAANTPAGSTTNPTDSWATSSTTTRSLANSDNGLMDLATPVLEVIMQLKAGLIKPSNDLRTTFADLFKRMDQQGDQLGFKGDQLQAVKFALAAFVDETVLTADFPLRDEWEKYPLQLEYFKEHLAGVTYFERLNQLLKDVEKNASVIEVYYLCLILGYKGRYKLYLEDQLSGVIENVADHLRRVNRLRAGALSPHWKVNDQPILTTAPSLPLWIKVTTAIVLGSTIVIFLILKFLLMSSLNA